MENLIAPILDNRNVTDGECNHPAKRGAGADPKTTLASPSFHGAASKH